MKELRDKRAVSGLLREIALRTKSLPSPVRIMEVCGTHTMALYRHGLTPLLAEAGVEMISGPGCPVCITPDGFHEAAIGLLSERENLTLAAFGDMTRVPTRIGSLQAAIPASRSRLRIVYSPEEALEEARTQPGRDVVFFGAGFETTIPAIALTVERAHDEGLKNFSALPAFWLIPPALRAVLSSGETSIAGFLYPGHVSVIIGTAPYEFVATEFGLPGAVAGFEPGDILLALKSTLDQIVEGRPRAANEYSRVVRKEGNPLAREAMDRILEPADAVWRGLGPIPRSGLKLREKFRRHDAETKYGFEISPEDRHLPHCRCGDVLRGTAAPEDCRLFGTKCSPESPIGPCMVSYEGACLIHHKFGGRKGKNRGKARQKD
jgi:hydrogenase expression/formation protein HypD